MSLSMRTLRSSTFCNRSPCSLFRTRARKTLAAIRSQQNLEVGQTVKVSPTSTTTITKVVSLSDTSNKGIYRIATPLPPTIAFNQFLIVDDKPLLMHTGLPVHFEQVKEAINTVIPVETLAYVCFSHDEADESGSVNDFCKVAPNVEIRCSKVEALINGTRFLKQPVGMADDEELSLGSMNVKWIDAPHVPHGWGCGYLFETTTRTLLCGDIMFQWGAEAPALLPAAPLSSVPGLQAVVGSNAYAPWTADATKYIRKMIGLQPQSLCIMHGSSFTGPDCAKMLEEFIPAQFRVPAPAV